MLQNSAKRVLASAATLMLLAVPASAGGLINEGCGCNGGAPVVYGARAVDYYVARRVYVPRTVYVRQRAYVRTPVYVVDQGPHYQAPLTGYTIPTGVAAPERHYYRARFGYRYGYRYRYGIGYRYGHRHRYGFGRPHLRRAAYGVRFGHRMRHGMHHGPAARRHLVGGPHSHGHPRPGSRGPVKKGR